MPLLSTVLLAALVACAGPGASAEPPAGPPGETTMWMETAQQATGARQRMDEVVHRVASLPEDERLAVHQALESMAATPDTVQGFGRARDIAQEARAALPREHRGSGPPPAVAALQPAAVLVLQAKAMRTGQALSSTGDVEQAKALLALCDGIDLGARSDEVKMDALVGLDALAGPALR